MSGPTFSEGNWVLAATLGSTAGLRVDPKYLENRRVNSTGRVQGPVKDNDGWWWVRFPWGDAPFYGSELKNTGRGQSGGWGDSPLG